MQGGGEQVGRREAGRGQLICHVSLSWGSLGPFCACCQGECALPLAREGGSSSGVEKWVLARRRSQLFLRNKAAHTGVGSRKGVKKKNNQCIMSALPPLLASTKKEKKEERI